MTQRFVFLFAFLWVLLPASAQDCPDIPGFNCDYCYENPEFLGYKAAFAEKDSVYWFIAPLKNGSRKLKMNLPKEKVDMGYLRPLYTNKILKLTTEDILFMERALGAWDKDKITIGYTKTASGLGYKITTKGTGKLPEKGKNVTVHYTGWLLDGKKFDSSVDRGQPFTFPLGLGKVIKGWDEGIALMPVGSKGFLMIPSVLGYGAYGAPGGVIPPNATLIFEVEIISAE